MVHHSRNSEQKQWDETVVIALGGMGRLLKAHLPAVVQLEAFPAGPPLASDYSQVPSMYGMYVLALLFTHSDVHIWNITRRWRRDTPMR